jgi:hypothetical protein
MPRVWAALIQHIVDRCNHHVGPVDRYVVAGIRHELVTSPCRQGCVGVMARNPPLPEKPRNLLAQLRELRGRAGAGRAWRQSGQTGHGGSLVKSGGQHDQRHVAIVTVRIDYLVGGIEVFLLDRGLIQQTRGVGVEPGDRRF